MWKISWQNLQMMLIDMPYMDYASKGEENVIEVKSEADIPEYLKRFKKKE